jgi:hypothetical protein
MGEKRASAERVLVGFIENAEIKCCLLSVSTEFSSRLVVFEGGKE